MRVMLGLLALVAIVLAIALPLALRNNDDDGTRDIVIPTPAPAPALTVSRSIIRVYSIEAFVCLSVPSKVADHLSCRYSLIKSFVSPKKLQIPSPAPTSPIVSWTGVLPPVGGPAGSAFGSAVALDETVLVVGAPLHAGTGAIFSSVNTGTAWSLQAPITGPETGSGFGTALDLLDGQLIVGAPNVKMADSEAESGAAYFYAFNPSNNQ